MNVIRGVSKMKLVIYSINLVVKMFNEFLVGECD